MGHIIEGWFDGVAEPVNPGGHGAYGILLKVDGQVVVGRGEYIGHGPTISNNVSEYGGFNAVVEEILNRNLKGVITIRGDSKLVICQLNGKWRVNGGLYLPFHQKAKALLIKLRETSGGVQLEWISRTKNEECDRFSKDVLLKRGIKFRIQPETVKA